MLRPAVHLLLHLLVPGAVAAVFHRRRFAFAWGVMLATMVVDVDHLLARPMYDPGRCSIGFHPLHTAPAVAAYTLLAIPRRTRLPAVGLLIHMALDAADCALMP